MFALIKSARLHIYFPLFTIITPKRHFALSLSRLSRDLISLSSKVLLSNGGHKGKGLDAFVDVTTFTVTSAYVRD